ncbi:MAG TPA: transketolase C-terminal domain-containing protein, partial [Halanaerobiales bacterium]|nr:transketolase C-terminal domain-containing protein [Halanaerobiales bacterium]
ELEKSGISARVINVSTIKPLDTEMIKKYSKDVHGVVTAEEHSIIGGLGAAICEALSDEEIRIKRVGINDQFGQSAANYEELLEYYGLTVSNIIKKAREIL